MGAVEEIPMHARTGLDAKPGPAEETDRPRVLLVDDDERNLLAVRSILEDLGEVVLARSGEEALRAEQELRRAEQRQAAIIQSLPMVLYLDPYGTSPRRPTYVSGDFYGITGFKLDEIAEDSTLWSDRLHPDDRDRVLAAMAARRKTGRSAIEYRWLCADGNYKHFLDQAVLLKDGDGKPVEFAGTLTDITEQRSLE